VVGHCDKCGRFITVSLMGGAFKTSANAIRPAFTVRFQLPFFYRGHLHNFFSTVFVLIIPTKNWYIKCRNVRTWGALARVWWGQTCTLQRMQCATVFLCVVFRVEDRSNIIRNSQRYLMYLTLTLPNCLRFYSPQMPNTFLHILFSDILN